MTDPLREVIKRNGQHEPFDEDQIRVALRSQVRRNPVLRGLDVEPVVRATVNGMADRMPTSEIDDFSASCAAQLTAEDERYGILAGNVLVHDMHRTAPRTYMECVVQQRAYREPHTDRESALISEDVYQTVLTHFARIQSAIVPERDLLFNYFGLKTLQKAYLLPGETPQYLYMRVALGIHGDDIESVLQVYTDLSLHLYTQASPTLFNSGRVVNQMSSCFLLKIKGDSLEGIYDTLKDMALISKNAGGIGLDISPLRGKGSYIKGTHGYADGLLPFCKVYNASSVAVNQGGRRPASYAMYLSPVHIDIEAFLDMPKNTGDDRERARELFSGIWVPDLFMERVEHDQEISLFSSDTARGLFDTNGARFRALYEEYEREGLARKKMPARELYRKICIAQIEIGRPYMLFADHCNARSNQQHLGNIPCSNLCSEIIQYSSEKETAVCNLATIALNAHVRKGVFDFESLGRVTRQIVRNLDRIIEVNYYPTPEARLSNMRHRPMGIGIQGLANLFVDLGLTYAGQKAQELFKRIMAHMYYHAVDESAELAHELAKPKASYAAAAGKKAMRERGVPGETYSYTTEPVEGLATHPSYPGSPLSQGILAPDNWEAGFRPEDDVPELDWQALREKARCGVRNSLFIALPPTASTAQIMGNNESFEAFTSNIYNRRVLSGEFQVVNAGLMGELRALGLWNEEMKDLLIAHRGSVQAIPEIPGEVKLLYRTVWEISQKDVVDMIAAGAPYIDQSVSMNIHLPNPTVQQVSSLHMYTWKKGLKTGLYYMRVQKQAVTDQFSVSEETLAKAKQQRLDSTASETEGEVCRMEDGCVMCGS